MNAESMPLKQHDHQQSAADPAAAAAGGGSAPFRTTKTTTRTTLVTRALVVVCGVAAVAGVTYLSTGLYPRSPVASGATGGVLIWDGLTSTPTQEAFIAQDSELMDLSPADQTIQYEAYMLYLNGMTVDELDAYYHINDNGQQDGGGAGARFLFRCCKDERVDSSGCVRDGRKKCWHSIPDQKHECQFVASRHRGKARACCRISPDNRVGTKFFWFSACT